MTEGKIVDPIEYGRLLHAVETIAKQVDRLPQLESDLQKANANIQTLEQSRIATDKKLDELITYVKHLNGADAKLERLGFRLDDSKEHRKDMLYLRTARRIAEQRNTTINRVKTGVLTAVSIAVFIWVASTLWEARHTVS